MKLLKYVYIFEYYDGKTCDIFIFIFLVKKKTMKINLISTESSNILLL